ncbi:hypothetical protein [Sphingomonas sp.]|jgi:hypothetical protein|uniref:hypothetical protein n=1 Tax=Sphingomonas sp. TaxID=28214 RepID=UPI002EDAE6E6
MKLEIVDSPVTGEKAAKARYRIAMVDGEPIRIRVVNADSPTFGADFAAAFRENVRRLRRENRMLDAAE